MPDLVGAFSRRDGNSVAVAYALEGSPYSGIHWLQRARRATEAGLPLAGEKTFPEKKERAAWEVARNIEA